MHVHTYVHYIIHSLQRLSPVTTTLSLQEQYIFIHDAILESVTCGDTQIVAGDLRDALEKLRMSTQTGQTGLSSQFQVKQVIHWGVGWSVIGPSIFRDYW